LIYQVDIQRRSYREMADRVTLATGLAFSNQKQLLFITDGGREIHALNPTTMRISRFTRQSAFRRLSGIALSEDNTMWIVDSGAQALFHLSAEGKILKRWP
jgi:sugar lactone lactonase YvrE